MDETIEFEIPPDEFIFQKLLLDIYKTCDEIYFREKKIIEITMDQKEKMASEIVNFIGYALTNLRTPLLRFRKKPTKKEMNELSKILSSRTEKDIFSRFVLSRHVAEKKIKPKRIPSYLTIAALVLLSKGKSVDIMRMKKKISKIKPFTIRTACFILPFIELHEKLQKEIEKGEIKVEEALKKGKIDEDVLRYIG